MTLLSTKVQVPFLSKIVTWWKCHGSRLFQWNDFLHLQFLLLCQIWNAPLATVSSQKNILRLTSKHFVHAYPSYLFHHVFGAVPSSVNTAILNPLILGEYSWLSTLMEAIPHALVLTGSSQPSLRSSMFIDEAEKNGESIMILSLEQDSR